MDAAVGHQARALLGKRGQIGRLDKEARAIVDHHAQARLVVGQCHQGTPQGAPHRAAERNQGHIGRLVLQQGGGRIQRGHLGEHQGLARAVPQAHATQRKHRLAQAARGRVGLRNAQNGQAVTRLADHVAHAAANGGTGGQNHAVGNGRRGMVAAPQRAVQHHQRGAALLEPGNHGELVRTARGTGNFHLAVRQHLDHQNFAHRAVNAGGVNKFVARLGALQGGTRGGHQAAGPHHDGRLGHKKHRIAVFPVAPD